MKKSTIKSKLKTNWENFVIHIKDKKNNIRVNIIVIVPSLLTIIDASPLERYPPAGRLDDNEKVEKTKNIRNAVNSIT